MTSNKPAVSAEDVLNLKKRAVLLRDKARALWGWADRKLEDAAEELNADLSAYAEALGENPVFAKILPLEDDYALLWASFLKYGEPGTEAWDHEGLQGSDLRALPLEDFFVVLAALGSQQALSFLEDYVRSLGEGKLTEAAEELSDALRHLKSGEKAMTFVEEQRVIELELSKKARVSI